MHWGWWFVTGFRTVACQSRCMVYKTYTPRRNIHQVNIIRSLTGSLEVFLVVRADRRLILFTTLPMNDVSSCKELYHKHK